jgi:transcription antitermination factor NusG
MTSYPTTKPQPVLCFALRVKARSEQAAAAALAGKGFCAFLPVYEKVAQWSDRKKRVELPLFPGYLFCRFDPLFRLPILTTPGVLGVVGFGKTPVPVEEHEIEAVKAVVASGLPARPWPFVHAGESVSITAGPLRGVNGTVRRIDDKQQFVVSVSLLQRSVSVAIDPSWVRRLG